MVYQVAQMSREPYNVTDGHIQSDHIGRNISVGCASTMKLRNRIPHLIKYLVNKVPCSYVGILYKQHQAGRGQGTTLRS